MAIVVNTNITSLKVQRNLNTATNGAAKAMERMTTGLKINSAADDAAGLVISKGLETQQRGSEVAINNAQNGINLLQTAEGSLGIMQDNLMRMRDLTLQAMNGGYSVSEIKALEQEVKLRAQEVDRTANGAKFNEFKIFDNTIAAGDAKDSLVLQIGAGAEKATNTIEITGVFIGSELSSLTKDCADGALGSGAVAFLDGDAIKDRDSFETLLNQIDYAVKAISERRGTIGASQNRLNASVESLSIQNENLSAARSRIVDADIAKESSEYTKNTILQQASAALLVQANQSPNIALSLI